VVGVVTVGAFDAAAPEFLVQLAQDPGAG